MAFLRDRRNLFSLLFTCGLLLALPVVMKAQRTGRPAAPETSRVSSAQDGRIRPPAAITCDRNHLTAYTGKVSSYSRRTGRTTLRIETDWDTTETVTLRHPRTSNPAKWFLLRGKAFKPGDWVTIESSRSQLQPNMRVTAWVCDDGRNAIIDWQPPTGDEATAPRSTP